LSVNQPPCNAVKNQISNFFRQQQGFSCRAGLGVSSLNRRLRHGTRYNATSANARPGVDKGTAQRGHALRHPPCNNVRSARRVVPVKVSVDCIRPRGLMPTILVMKAQHAPHGHAPSPKPHTHRAAAPADAVFYAINE